VIDITQKRSSLREARAGGFVRCDARTAELIRLNSLPKGNLFDVARAAGLIAAKRTDELIPHCHPVSIDMLSIDFTLSEGARPGVLIEATGKSIGRTGIEMEVLTAVSVAALTIYDLLKPVSKDLEILSIKLLEKLGGKSDARFQAKAGLTAAVLVVSDSTAAGQREDRSGRIIQETLERHGLKIASYAIVPDERDQICEAVKTQTKNKVDFIFTTGGTGPGPRDGTPEAVRSLLEKELPGVAATMRSHGSDRTPWAMLSRSLCGVIDRSIIVCLPGSSGGVRESLAAILPGIFHARDMVEARGHD